MEKIIAGHPLSQSEDIIKQNLDILKSLFPTIVKEGKIDIDELKALLGEQVEDNEEYYRFTWAGKSQARQEANKPSTGTLRPNKAESKDWDTTGNIFIEGDNLEVLKLLQKSYANRIKMIYIDPPYNTGKDFVYKDNYKDNLRNYLSLTGQTDDEGNRFGTNAESDGRYHSNWLTMMYPRLILARKVLKEDGFISISINDFEEHNLRKLCDDVFGSDNFLSKTIWKNGRTAAAHFTTEHEYVLTYAKNKIKLPLFKFDGESIISDRAIKKPSEKNSVSAITFPKGIDFLCEDRIFPNSFGENEPVKIVQGILEAKNNKLENQVTIEAAWTMKDMIEAWLDGEEVIDQKGQKVIKFFFKSNGVLQYEKEKGTVHPKSIIEGITTKTGTNELFSILDGNYFDFPKPIALLNHFYRLVAKDDIVMDFFAGSGSSAQAIMQLNFDDAGNRRYICVQLPELNKPNTEALKAGYCTLADVTKDRIRKAALLIQRRQESDSSVSRTLDLGFKAFTLGTSNLNAWDGSIDTFEQNLFSSTKNIKEDRTEEEVLYEILLKSGLDLTQQINEKEISGKKVYSIGFGALFICLADKINTTVAEAIGQWKTELDSATCKVIFKDGGLTDVEKTNSIQILKRYGITEVNTI